MTAADDLERRIDNWVRWRLGERGRGGLGFPSVSPLVRIGMPVARRARDAIPVLAGEAQDTDAAIGRLRPEHRQILEARYLRASLASAGQLAGLLGIHRNTVANRLAAAKSALADELTRYRFVQRARTLAARQEWAQAALGADD